MPVYRICDKIKGGIMRLKISLQSEKEVNIPFNYQYELQSVIYKIISQAEPEFATFLHDDGFSKDNKAFKFFTFSKLSFRDQEVHTTKKGFENIKRADFSFSTRIDKIFENFVLGIFAGKVLNFYFGRNHIEFHVINVEVLKEIEFNDSMKFICLSPISVSTQIERNGELKKHFFDYMNPDEREHFKLNIYKNLCHKYEVYFDKTWDKEQKFNFSFDPEYIAKRNGNISKLMKFKNNIMVKGFEAPFTVETYPELIKIGYECGFGDNNSAGFGCVEVVHAHCICF